MCRTTLAAAALMPACALALSACGSSAGSTTVSVVGASASTAAENNAHLTSAQVNARLDAAVVAVTAMHIKGTMSFVWNQPTTVTAPPVAEVIVLPNSTTSA